MVINLLYTSLLLQIDGVELGWALGYMINATNRIPTESTCMEVSDSVFYGVLAAFIIVLILDTQSNNLTTLIADNINNRGPGATCQSELCSTYFLEYFFRIQKPTQKQYSLS